MTELDPETPSGSPPPGKPLRDRIGGQEPVRLGRPHDVVRVIRDNADVADSQPMGEIVRLRGQLSAVTAERDKLKLDLSGSETIAAAWPKCPDGCGCRLGTEDPDAQECGCHGPCTMECRENGYPDAPSYRDLAVAAITAERDRFVRAVDDLVRVVDIVTAERDKVAAELHGVHGELTASGIKGDPGNHWAPLLVAQLRRERDEARERLADVTAENECFRAAIREIRTAVIGHAALGDTPGMLDCIHDALTGLPMDATVQPLDGSGQEADALTSLAAEWEAHATQFMGRAQAMDSDHAINAAVLAAESHLYRRVAGQLRTRAGLEPQS